MHRKTVTRSGWWLILSLYLCSLLLTVGCSAVDPYPNTLEKPTDTVSNIYELAAICDYYAFYEQKEFTVTVSDDYAYSVPGKEDIEHELNYLYFNSELINGVLGMNATQEENRWHFTYTLYDYAKKSADNSQVKVLTDVGYSVPSSSRAEDYNDFATEDPSRPACTVRTSQQLWYAAEHGYRIEPVAGSAAETYYNAAKDILRKIVDDGQTEFEKIAAIYDYLIHTAAYDHASNAAWKAGDNADLYPDVNAAPYKCYFLEGFFDNHAVVCDGFAKMYVLLASMEGIDIVRAMGAEEPDYETRNVFGHAYCFVRCFDRWFLSCPTWGQPVLPQEDTKAPITHLLQRDFLLTSHEAIAPYQSNMWQDIQKELVQSDADYAASGVNSVLEYCKDKSIAGVSRVVTNQTTDDEFRTLLEQIKDTPYTQMELCSFDLDALFRLDDLVQTYGIHMNVEEISSDPVLYRVLLLHI